MSWARMRPIGALILCLGVCVFLWVFLQTERTPDSVIIVDADGFHPAQVTVSVGSLVRFVNGGTEWYWPASNSHPTHELYPAFDPREPVAPNDHWDFVAEEKGYWAYHDHLRPHVRGMVIVE